MNESEKEKVTRAYKLLTESDPCGGDPRDCGCPGAKLFQEAIRLLKEVLTEKRGEEPLLPEEMVLSVPESRDTDWRMGAEFSLEIGGFRAGYYRVIERNENWEHGTVQFTLERV